MTATVQSGDRVALVFTSDPYTKLQPGELGTVAFVDDTGTVHVKWDAGDHLGLVPGVDRFRVVAKA